MIFLKIAKTTGILITSMAAYARFINNNVYFFLFILLIIIIFIFLYIFFIFIYIKFKYNAKYFNKLNNTKTKLATIALAPGLILIIGTPSLISGDFSYTIETIGNHIESVINSMVSLSSSLQIKLPESSVSGQGVWSMQRIPSFHLCKPFTANNQVILGAKYSSESPWVAASLNKQHAFGVNIPPQYLENPVSIIATITDTDKRDARVFVNPKGFFGSVRFISEYGITSQYMSFEVKAVLGLEEEIINKITNKITDNNFIKKLFNLKDNVPSHRLSNVRNSVSNSSNVSSEWESLMERLAIRNSTYTNSSSNLESVSSFNTSSGNPSVYYTGSNEDMFNTLSPRPTSQVYTGNHEDPDSPTLPNFNYLSQQDNSDNVSENGSQISVHTTRSTASVNTFGGRK